MTLILKNPSRGVARDDFDSRDEARQAFEDQLALGADVVFYRTSSSAASEDSAVDLDGVEIIDISEFDGGDSE